MTDHHDGSQRAAAQADVGPPGGGAPFGSTAVFARLDRVVTREIAGETLLVPIRADVDDMHHIFAMNRVAATVWNALDGATPVGGVVAAVCAAFEVEPGQAEQDVAALLGELVQAGLVREVGP